MSKKRGCWPQEEGERKEGITFVTISAANLSTRLQRNKTVSGRKEGAGLCTSLGEGREEIKSGRKRGKS